jgi:cell wall-associated NlpC family hydrolase
MTALWGIVALAVLWLAGCGGAPPPLPPLAPPPLPQARTSQELALEQALNGFYGAPYRSGGTNPSGVDCSGLVQTVFHQAGLNLPRTVAQQFTAGQAVAPADLRFGDVVFFNRFCKIRDYNYLMAGIIPQAQAEQVCHDGIYVGQGRFVHASPRGVCVSRLDAEIWRRSYMGARRFLTSSSPGP